jgi:hypothetical protein
MATDILMGAVGAAALLTVVAIFLATSGGSSGSDATALKTKACADYEAWKKVAYQETLGMGAGDEFKAHLDRLQSLEDAASDSFAAVAKSDSEWVRSQEAFRKYVLAMIGYSQVLDMSGPEDAATRQDASVTIGAACERL